ncbi:hypothetical protein OKW27_000865 [Paraburkholderia sp. 35.1]
MPRPPACPSWSCGVASRCGLTRTVAHISVPLDFEPGDVLCYRAQVLMCAHHSALLSGVILVLPEGESEHTVYL